MSRAYLKIPFRLKSSRVPAAARQKFLEISRYPSKFLTSLRSKPEPFASKANFEIGSSVRVRIAPSPTGRFHIGTARTALFNWLFAKKETGVFILRIEDTDRERSKKEYEEDIRAGLTWLGLRHDELYRQSERTDFYERALKKMLEDKKAFFCGHTVAELEAEGESQRTAKEPPRHVCSHRDGKRSEGIIRFKNDSTERVTVRDIIRGDILYDAKLLGDFSLAKNIREPLYNFAAVVDDSELKISHVIRGEDHLPNTPKQILIDESLGLPIPQWAHLPLLLGADKSKLSKRHGALALLEYRDVGYLPDAMINFIALLGWHPKDEVGEVLDRDTLIREFSLERIQKSGAIVSAEKLDWLNKEYIKKLSKEEYRNIADSYVSEKIKSEYKPAEFEKAIDAMRPRVSRLGELDSQLGKIIERVQYDKAVLLWRGKIAQSDAGDVLDELINLLSNIQLSEFNAEAVEKYIEPIIQKRGKGSVLWPLRAALSGRETSLGPYELTDILGKEETLERLRIAKRVLAV
ncbi:MAG TPA: glutamate--tRNA ligase [Candidatus Paceibacterota bacterium]